ncbi:MAG TPA: hypothetical protein VG944_20790 [Fimbriimonas sp.]|nr:hypothetical protein [Fimbriimonas sp.]
MKKWLNEPAALNGIITVVAILALCFLLIFIYHFTSEKQSIHWTILPVLALSGCLTYLVKKLGDIGKNPQR